MKCSPKPQAWFEAVCWAMLLHSAALRGQGLGMRELWFVSRGGALRNALAAEGLRCGLGVPGGPISPREPRSHFSSHALSQL